MHYWGNTAQGWVSGQLAEVQIPNPPSSFTSQAFHVCKAPSHTHWQPTEGHSLLKAPPQLFQLLISTGTHPKSPKFWHRLMKTPLGCVMCAKHNWDFDAVECLDFPASAKFPSPDTGKWMLKNGLSWPCPCGYRVLGNESFNVAEHLKASLLAFLKVTIQLIKTTGCKI